MTRRALLAALLLSGCAGGQTFSFWQLSDTHVPVQGTPEVLRAAAAQRAIDLVPYGITAPAPSFTIVTGDIFEFGPGEGSWERWRELTAGWPCPLYLTPGNHDNTWWLLRPQLQREHGSLPYSFEEQGVLFLILDSAGRQDPRPAWHAEELAWIRARLAKVDPATPIIVACHHPLGGSEWASPWDYERLIELLQPYNVVLMLVGHGHGHRAMKFADIDAVMGGSTFDKNAPGWAGGEAGYLVVDIRDGRLRAAYRRHSEPAASLPMIDKPLRAEPLPIPAVTSTEIDGDGVRVTATYPGEATGTVALDDGDAVPLTRAGEVFSARLPLGDALPGRHVVRARFEQNGRVRLASREFDHQPAGAPRARWRVDLGAAVRGRPAAAGEQILVATVDGHVVSLAAADGAELWRVRLGGEVLGAPLVAADRLLVAATDGRLTCLNLAGRQLWWADLGAPLVATPAVDGGTVYLGAVDGTLHAVDLADGRVVWSKPIAAYSIETPAVVADGTVFVGAWDTNLHAVDAATGEVRWKSPAAGARAGAARYYSPADAPPVVLGDSVWAPDRNYRLGRFDRRTGELAGELRQVAAAAPTADGQGLWLRRFGADGRRLTRLAADGTETWSVEILGGSLPIPPTEADGLVAIAADDGVVSLHSAADGTLLGRYRAGAGLYCPGGALLHDGAAYVGDLGGAVVRIEPPAP